MKVLVAFYDAHLGNDLRMLLILSGGGNAPALLLLPVLGWVLSLGIPFMTANGVAYAGCACRRVTPRKGVGNIVLEGKAANVKVKLLNFA